MKYSLLPILCVFALATTSHGVDALEELQAAYPAVEKDGYTYIKMDHVMPGGSAVMDVTTLRLSYRKGSDPQNDPLVIVNYSAEGYPESERQSNFLERALPILAKRSQRPIIFIDATALRNNRQGLPETVHMGGLLGDQEENKLGPNATKVDFNRGEYVLPYGYVTIGGEKVFDFSYMMYSKSVPEVNIQKNLITNLATTVKMSNNRITKKEKKQTQ